MLVLSRKAGESIVIGDDIVVTVLSVNGTQVKLGFAAPSDVEIWREELYHKVTSSPENNGNK